MNDMRLALQAGTVDAATAQGFLQALARHRRQWVAQHQGLPAELQSSLTEAAREVARSYAACRKWGRAAAAATGAQPAPQLAAAHDALDQALRLYSNRVWQLTGPTPQAGTNLLLWTYEQALTGGLPDEAWWRAVDREFDRVERALQLPQLTPEQSQALQAQLGALDKLLDLAPGDACEPWLTRLEENALEEHEGPAEPWPDRLARLAEVDAPEFLDQLEQQAQRLEAALDTLEQLADRSPVEAERLMLAMEALRDELFDSLERAEIDPARLHHLEQAVWRCHGDLEGGSEESVEPWDEP